MCQLKLVAVLVCLIISCAPAFSQPNKIRYTLGGGISIIWAPENLERIYNTGFQITVGAGYAISPKLTLGGKLNYNSFSLDKLALLRSTSTSPNPLTVVDGGTITLWELTAEASYHPFCNEGRVDVYVLGGPGLNVGLISDIAVFVPLQDVRITKGSSDVDLMVTAGVGFKFWVTQKIALFLEGRFNNVLSGGNDLRYTPLRAGFIF